MSDDPKRNDPQKKSWLVSYDGSFWHAGEDTGREVPVRKEFLWGRKKWVIPALYLCQEGLVIDFCMEAEPAELKAFIEKWDLARTACDRRSCEQELKLHLEHPLDVSFSSHISLNGNDLKSEHSCAVSWLPEACFPGSRFPDKMTPDPEAKAALDHYGLDRDKAWSIHRHAYRWAPDMRPFTPGTWRETLKAAGPFSFIWSVIRKSFPQRALQPWTSDSVSPSGIPLPERNIFSPSRTSGRKAFPRTTFLTPAWSSPDTARPSSIPSSQTFQITASTCWTARSAQALR